MPTGTFIHLLLPICWVALRHSHWTRGAFRISYMGTGPLTSPCLRFLRDKNIRKGSAKVPCRFCPESCTAMYKTRRVAP